MTKNITSTIVCIFRPIPLKRKIAVEHTTVSGSSFVLIIVVCHGELWSHVVKLEHHGAKENPINRPDGAWHVLGSKVEVAARDTKLLVAACVVDKSDDYQAGSEEMEHKYDCDQGMEHYRAAVKLWMIIRWVDWVHHV